MDIKLKKGLSLIILYILVAIVGVGLYIFYGSALLYPLIFFGAIWIINAQNKIRGLEEDVRYLEAALLAKGIKVNKLDLH